MLGQLFGRLSSEKEKPSLNPEYTLPPILQGYLSRPSDGQYHTNAAVATSSTSIIDAESQPTSGTSFGRRFFVFNDSSGNELDSFSSLSRRQRLLYFSVSLLCASLFFSFSFIFIPLIATPMGMRKFVLMYILGNIALLFSFSFAYGPCNYLKSLFSIQKLTSTLIYFTSLFVGVYGVLIWHSSVCAVLALLIQIGLAFWNLKNFIYVGSKFFSFLSRGASLRVPGFRDSDLPI